MSFECKENKACTACEGRGVIVSQNESKGEVVVKCDCCLGTGKQIQLNESK